MTLKDLLFHCRNRDAHIIITALAYFKDDHSYYSFRTICDGRREGVLVKDYRDELSEQELALNVKSFSFDGDNIWIDVIEWINRNKD